MTTNKAYWWSWIYILIYGFSCSTVGAAKNSLTFWIAEGIAIVVAYLMVGHFKKYIRGNEQQ